MSDSVSRRLDRLDRAHEWDTAMAWVDRMIEWALASGRIDLLEAAAFKLKLLVVAPARDEFLSGKWFPEPASPDDIEAGRAFIGEIDAWHTDQRQANERGT